MIRKEIIDLIVARTKIAQRDLIEKDLILHRLLLEFSAQEHFAGSYAFKGGTCLMKCYLTYYRFSEDLDFTYIHQKEFHNKSGKQLRALLSQKIDNLLDIFTDIARRTGLDFKPSKNDKRYVELGGSNKQATFKMWYTPDGASQQTFIKIQINFVEKLHYPLVERTADTIVFGKHDKFQSAFLLPDNSEWLLKIPTLVCYDIKEILIEKMRAILTRRGTKARDYIDVYMIQKHYKLDVKTFKKQILEKVKASLGNTKYSTNLKNKQETGFTANEDEEQRILLVQLPKDYDAFKHDLSSFLQELAREI